MSIAARLRALARTWFRRRELELDLHDELQAYADLVADEHRRGGMDDDEAARRGRVALGGASSVAQAVRERRVGAGIERFLRDIRHALRGLRRAPGLAAMAVLTLGAGIGATTTIFSVADAALFKPLPYRHPDRLVQIAYVLDRGTVSERRMMGLSSWQQLDQWRAEPALFEGIELAGNPRRVREVAGATGDERFVGALAPGTLGLLGVTPLTGRAFTIDDLDAGANPILLAEDFWRREFDADRNVPGTRITIDGQPHTIVGVMPATLRWDVGGSHVIGWTLIDERAERASGGRKTAGEVVRLREGLTVDAANREIAAAVARIQTDVPVADRWDIEIHPLDSRTAHLGDIRLALLVFLGASGCLLLVPCANVASLLLASGLERRGELAIRSALGASRGRLVRQLLTEGFVLALLGGAAGLLLTWWSVAVIPPLIPPRLPLFAANPLAVDGRVLTVCLVSVFVATLLCSLLPALRHSRHQAADLALGSVRAVGGRGQRRLHHVLQAAQVALALVLLSAQTLLASSFIRMVMIDPGYDLDGLSRVIVSVPPDRYPGPAAAAFFDDVLRRTSALPGITAATFGNSPTGELRTDVEAFEKNDARFFTDIFLVAPDYFQEIGIPIRAGRAFSHDDRQGSAPVIAISDELADAIWPGESPLGRRLRPFGVEEWLTVVAVVGATKSADLMVGQQYRLSQVYVPLTQGLGMPETTRSLIVRSAADDAAIATSVADVIRAMESQAEVTNTGAIAHQYVLGRQTPRLYLTLMTVMAVVALGTAVVGLYASTSGAVTRRRREIGIRLALGADAARIRRSILAATTAPLLVGLIVGVAGAFWLTHVLASLLYEVQPGDPWSMAAAVVVLAGAMLAGAAVPARAASRIDPAITLRTE